MKWAETGPMFGVRWAKTHTFLQRHGIYDVWLHTQSRTVLVQCVDGYQEFDVWWALKHFFYRHSDAHARLTAFKAMTDDE